MPHLTDQEELDSLKSRLNARTNPDGKPKPGYKNNVAALRREIARLEAIVSKKSS